MSVSTSEGVAGVRFGRRQSKGLLLGFSAAQVVVIGVAAALLAFCGAAGHMLIGVLLAVTVGSMAVVRWQSRPLVESVGVVGWWLLRSLTGQTRFRSRPFTPRPAGTMALPGDASALRFVLSVGPHGPNDASSNEGVAMIHDPHRQTLTAVCEVSYPAFVLLDAHAQARRVSAWGRVLAVQAALGRTATLQVMESVIPDPGRGVLGWWHGHGRPDAGWAGGEYETLMRMYAPSSAVHRTLIAVSLDMRAARGQIARAGRGIKGAVAVLSTDITQLTAALARAELTVERWLDEAHLAAVIRGAYDPGVDLEHDNPGATLEVAGPMAIDEEWDHVVHDSGVSMTVWISQWPTTETFPNFMHQLIFEGGVRRTLSLFMRPIPAAEAARAVRREKVDYLTDRRQKEKIGQVLAESDHDEYRDVVARERALNEGHADMRYTALMSVTAPTVEEARAACDTLRRAANVCGMETQILTGRQAQAFTACALPLARVIA